MNKITLLNFTTLEQSFSKKIVSSLMLLLVFFTSNDAFAQPSVLFTGLNSTTPAPTNSRFALNDMGVFRQIRFQANQNASASSLGWAFHSGTTGSPNYNPCWRPYTGGNTLGVNGFIPTSFANGARYNTGGGGADGLLPAITSGNYYTFNVMENATADNQMALLETSYNPVGLVSQSVVLPLSATGTGTVSITTSAAPSSGEFVYMRYSLDNWATSAYLAMTFTGSTGVAYIPCDPTPGTAVQYYFFSSNKTAAEINADITTFGTQNVFDIYTLNLLNNGGSNYSYTQPSTTGFTGVYNVPGSCYPTLASFITAINAGSVTGPVTVRVAAGYTETAPSGGFVLNQTGTAANTITFVKDGIGANPTFTAPAHTAGLLHDAVFEIVGGDFITIDGFTFLERNFTPLAADTAAGTNTMTEYGVALSYANTSNGCQNITIRNCTIDLNRTYTNTFGIYSNSTHSATAPTTSATATGANGGNNNLTITSNTITDVNQGIVVVGPTAATAQNTGLVIGGGVGLGNSITNYGTAVQASGYNLVSGTMNGILVRNTKNYTISNNTVTSSNAVTVGTVRGIFFDTFGAAPTGTLAHNINNNTISVRSSNPTGDIFGILLNGTTGNATTTLNINANDFNTFGHAVASSGVITFIRNLQSVLNSSISNNTFTNISVNTTGSVTFISDDVSSAANGTKNVNGNAIVTAFNKTGAGGTLTLYTSGVNATSPSTATINNNNNNFSNITVTGATAIAGWYNEDGVTTAPAPTKNFNNNTFSNWTGGSGTIAVALVGFSSVTEISNNIISNISSSGQITGLQLTAFNKNCYNNEIRDLTTTGASNISGMVISSGGNHNVYRNKIYNLNANNAGASAFGLSITGTSASTNVDFYNNLIGKLSSSNGSGTDVLRGISITSTGTTSTNNIFHNTIFLDATSSGANFGTSGIFHTFSTTATTSALNLRNNIIVNNSTPAGTGRTVAFRRSAATNLNNYATTSNNNLFFAGTPGANNIIYSDGTNNDQTLAAFKTRMATRDQASQTENTTFQSTTGSNANFLRIAAGTTSYAESGAVLIATPNINTDYWGITRPFPSPTNGGTAPDMGASEFDGIPALVNCTTPADQATSLVPGTITSNTATASFTAAASNPTGYLVVASNGTPFVGTPVDGTTYTAGNALGNGAVIQMSSSTTASNFALPSNTSGNLAIFSYNTGACIGGPKYNTVSPLTGVVTTCAAAPTANTVTSITGSSASINWTASSAGGGAGTISYIVEVSTDAGFASQISGSPFSAGTSVTQALTGLSGSTTYFYRIKANNTFCDSAFITGSFTTNQIPATLPYSDNLNTNNFTLINGAQTNKWAYGSAAGNPANAIYISSDNGVTNNYNNGSTSVVHAYREIIIPSGTTTGSLSFDWRGIGETCCDFMRVWLVPVSFTPTAGTEITSGSGRIQVGGVFNQQASWNNYLNSSVNLSTFAGSNMRLVFEWVNDGSVGTSPAAAVDNLSLIIPAPITITPASSTSICSGNSVSLTASSTNTNYTYTWSPATGLNTTSGATVIASPTTTTTYTVTGVDGAQSATQTVTITINPTPSDVTVTPATATICENTIQTLTASGGSITGATTTVNSGTVNLSIPDNSLTTGVSQNLVVSGIPASATITKVDVLLNITHPFDSDLRINLEGPNGQIVNLINQRGSSSNNFTNTIATSNTSAASFSTGSAPFTGTFTADLANQATIGTTPAVSTSTFSSLFATPNGTWKVRVYDDASVFTGTLVNCSITLTYNVSNIITWSQTPATPNTLFTDVAGTIAYDGVSFTNTIYAKPSASTTYTASATIGSCTKTATSVITVNPLPTASISGNNGPICSGANATFTLTGTSDAVVTYNINGGSNTTATLTGGTATVTITGATSNQTLNLVSINNPSTSCNQSLSGSSTVTVNPLPTASISGNNGPTVCSGNNITFNLTGTSGAVVTYNLNGGSNTTATLTGGSATVTVNGATVTQTLNLVSVTDGTCPATLSGSSTVSVGDVVTWDGTSWSPSAPTATSTVIFTGNYTIGANFDACSISVSNNAVVSVTSGFNVYLNGAIDVASGSSFTLNNNANLLQSNPAAVNTGNIIVKRQTNPLIRLDYTLWSSPVTGQGLYAFSPFTFANRFYVYDTTSNLYNNSSIGFNVTGTNAAGVNGTDNANVLFTTGKGYLIRLPYNHPTAPVVFNGSFTGVPNNGTKTITLANVSATQQFNAVGNPYPSPINIAQFATDNTNAIEPTLYFWRKTNNTASPSYCTWNTTSSLYGDNGEAYTNSPNGVIQTGQGFLVEAKDGATSLEFNNGQRVANNANQFFRTNTVATPTTQPDAIWLNLTGTGAEFSQAVVSYFTNATLGADAYDSKYFNDGAVALNMLIGSTEYVIQGRPTFQATDIVPLNYKVTTAGNYTFTIDHVDGLFAGGAQAIYIKDNQDGSYHNLSTPYTFTSTAGTFANRFELVYQTALTTNDNNFTANSINVIKQQNDVVVRTSGTTMKEVTIYDIRGRVLVTKTNINASETKINVGTTNQVLLVQVTTVDGVKATKKVVN